MMIRFLLVGILLAGCGDKKEDPSPERELKFSVSAGGDCDGKPCVQVEGESDPALPDGVLKAKVESVLAMPVEVQ